MLGARNGDSRPQLVGSVRLEHGAMWWERRVSRTLEGARAFLAGPAPPWMSFKRDRISGLAPRG